MKLSEQWPGYLPLDEQCHERAAESENTGQKQMKLRDYIRQQRHRPRNEKKTTSKVENNGSE